MKANSQPITRSGVMISKLFIRVMFRAVQGWKKEAPEETDYFVVQAEDGSALEGFIRPSSTGETKGIILLCHPFLKYGMHYFANNDLDRAMAAQGFHVVSFNFKGFGRSSVKGHAFSDDVLSVAKHMRERFPGLPLHLLGCSFGGFHLSHALVKERDLFASVTLDSVPCSVTVFFKRGVLARAMHWISHSHLAEATGTHPIVNSLKHVRGLPIQFLHGTEDEYLPARDLDELQTHCSEIRFVSFPGCGHLGNYKLHKDKYVNMVASFINQHSQLETR